jgi:cell division septation protein DedD
MNSLIDNDDEFARGDRELTLSTGAILGIFLGLVLLCGLFFGFGYKMGSHKAVPAAEIQASSPAAESPAPTTDFNAFKPAAGSPATGSSPKATVVVPSSPGESSGSNASAPVVVASHPAATEAPAPARNTPAASAHPVASPVANPAPSATGNFVVQVAAVSLQEDADLLVGALRSKGYTVTTHAQPDKLIHIQVGPFANRKDADAMRQRLLGDGYNAIVK